jgi:putative RNA 2'-phosphotransferase
MKDRFIRTSKLLSLVLRHRPEKIGLNLDDEGWVSVSELIKALAAYVFPLTSEELQEVVRCNDKKRFSFSPDMLLIRANQGHSVTVELGYEPKAPPPILYHGTAERFLASIRQRGLIKGKRHHVHLSDNTETARAVGRRYGVPVLLGINAGRMHADGYLFFRSDNGVWLTERVPLEYITFAGR